METRITIFNLYTLILTFFLADALHARIMFDRSLYKNSKYYSRGLLTITQYDTPDSIFFNPANIELTSRRYIEGLTEQSRNIYLVGRGVIDCVEKTGLSSYSKIAEESMIKICLEYNKEILINAIEKISKRKKYNYIRSCLTADANSIHVSRSCYEKVVKTVKFLEKYQKNIFYIVNVDSSIFGLELLEQDNEDARTQHAIENRGDPAAFYAGHSLLFYSESYAIGLIQNQNLSAIASFDEIENIENDSAGLLSINADYSKTNGLIFTSGAAVNENFNIGANIKLINRHTSQYVADITDLEKIKDVQSLRNTQDGTGVGMDLGITYIRNSICLAGAIENVSDLHLKKEITSGKKIETIPQLEKLGASYQFKFNRFRMELGVEAEDISNDSDLSLGSRVRLGSSACLDWTVCFNLGVLNGYISSGISSDSHSKFKYSIARYTRDLSNELGLRPETHYAFQLGVYL
ncbi:MAG: conjugal transfer protein TraF [Oligoflexales bacterium]